MRLKFKNLKYAFRCLGVLIKSHPWFLFGSIISLLCMVIQTLIPINVVSRIITAINNGQELNDIIVIILVNIGVLTLCDIINIVISFLMDFINSHFTLAFSTVLFRKLGEIDYSFHESPDFLDNYTRALDNGAERIYSVASNLMGILKTIVQSLAVLAIILTIHYLAVVYAIGISIIYVLLRRRGGYLAYDRMTEARPYERKRWYISRTYFVKDAIPDIKISDINEVMLDEHEHLLQETLKVYHKYTIKKIFFDYFGSLLMLTIYPFVLGVICYFTLLKNNNEALAILASLTVGAATLSSLLLNFTDKINTILINGLETNVTFSVLDMDSKIEGKGGKTLEGKFESLKVEDITFSYLENKEVLKDVSFHVNKGEKIAIVGHNGAGKTTLVKLLLRLYDVNKGKIFINDTLYNEIDPKSLRKMVGAVFQNSEIYSVTIAENILLRKMETKEDEELVIKALKFSGIYDDICKLPDGINTMVTREFRRDGAMFSGGQTQKIAVARGYAQNYDLFVLDEPSSALDPIAEAKMYHNMLELGKDKTLIFISHRLSATANVDRIYLFEHGKIVEAGTHEELMNIKEGRYKEMFISQAEKYLGDNYD